MDLQKNKKHAEAINKVEYQVRFKTDSKDLSNVELKEIKFYLIFMRKSKNMTL